MCRPGVGRKHVDYVVSTTVCAGLKSGDDKQREMTTIYKAKLKKGDNKTVEYIEPY